MPQPFLWLIIAVLFTLKSRGMNAPKLAVGDGAMVMTLYSS
jgi:hypothetical protein